MLRREKREIEEREEGDRGEIEGRTERRAQKWMGLSCVINGASR